MKKTVVLGLNRAMQVFLMLLKVVDQSSGRTVKKLHGVHIKRVVYICGGLVPRLNIFDAD